MLWAHGNQTAAAPGSDGDAADAETASAGVDRNAWALSAEHFAGRDLVLERALK